MKIDFAKKPTALAPMQDITDAHFFATIANLGAPDFFVSEFFRVTDSSRLEKHILDAVLSNPASKPVCAQLIGHSERDIVRTISYLKEYDSIKYLDLNLGCPAPKVYRKNVGGALLKDVKKIASILETMRSNWHGYLSVKMRIGFADDKNFLEILKVIKENDVDFITLHARTVAQLYRPSAEHSYTKKAVEFFGNDIPVIANGDITSAQKAKEIMDYTNCSGVMIGRSAVRNPWIFRQINEFNAGKEVFIPKLKDVREYIYLLEKNALSANCNPKKLDGRMKKFLNFIALSVDKEGHFLKEMRLAKNSEELNQICDKHLLGKNSENLFAYEPYLGLCSRPNHEL